MIPELSIKEVKILISIVDNNNDQVGWRQSSTVLDGPISHLEFLGYIKQLPSHGMSDYTKRYVATPTGRLRLLNPDLIPVYEVMET